MTNTPQEALTRPERVTPTPVPPIPDVAGMPPEEASTEYSHYRTGLSNHRTGLSEHRTDLSEFRTDLSQHRTGLSEHRTELSGHRTEMSMRRTGMSFHRTRMSADRTLMSVMRTALSLIGFGFTLYQAFEKLRDAGVLHHAAAPRNFGLTLVLLGVLLLIGGIVNHVRFAVELRETRSEMRKEGLIHGESLYPVSISFICALILLLVGLAAGASIIFDFSLFG